ncbi:MAG: flagellar biosynthetic protein FliR [Planctomycetota bacterium]
MTTLGPILDHLPGWLLVLFRLTGVFLLAPVFGSRTIPRLVKVFLVVGLALCVYPVLVGAGVAGPGAVGIASGRELQLWVLLPLVAAELLLGYVIGYCASLPLIGMQVGGQVIDQQMGVSAGGVFNPDLDAEAGVIGQLLFLTGLTIFLILGGHHAILLALVGSFEAVPIGGFVTPATAGSGGFESYVALVIGLLTVMFDVALRVSMPLLCILFLLRVAMGFIGRTVPQMNILSVGFIFYILAGLVVLIVGVAAVLGAFDAAMSRTLHLILEAFTVQNPARIAR